MKISIPYIPIQFLKKVCMDIRADRGSKKDVLLLQGEALLVTLNTEIQTLMLLFVS